MQWVVHVISGRKKQIHSDIKQVIADNLWRAYSRWVFEDGGRPRFKGKGHGLHSIRGKKNSTGITWKPETHTVRYGGVSYKVVIDRHDDYALSAIRDPKDPSKFRKAKYCTIVRRNIRGKVRWFVQILLEGLPPVKIIPAPNTSRLAIDPSMQSMTLVTEDGLVEKVRITPIADALGKEARRTQRKMDRSRRATNPENFESNGVVKKGSKAWNKSKNYQKLQKKLAEEHRRVAEARKREHGRFINLLFQIAGSIRIEKNSWKAMQRGRYGRAVGRGAPGAFVMRLKSKAERAGSKCMEIDPRKVRPTQRDLLSGEFIKHELSERRVRMGDTDFYIDRDVAACVNLLFCDPEKGAYDVEGIERFLEAVKQRWLDAGVIVKIEDAMRMPERELRRVLGKGIPVSSLERLHQEAFQDLRRDVGTEEAPSSLCRAEEPATFLKPSGLKPGVV